MAVDIDLEQPVVLAVVVSVHVCPVCGRMFREQPPFVRPRAIYTQRVVQKAIEPVYHDRMAMRYVPDRLFRGARSNDVVICAISAAQPLPNNLSKKISV